MGHATYESSSLLLPANGKSKILKQKSKKNSFLPTVLLPCSRSHAMVLHVMNHEHPKHFHGIMNVKNIFSPFVS